MFFVFLHIRIKRGNFLFRKPHKLNIKKVIINKMLKKILSISGKSGLFELISQGRNMLIVESLSTHKRQPAYSNEKILSLGDIAMYTEEGEVPLAEVLLSMKKKEEGKTVSIDLKKADKEELGEYLATVLPNYDRTRVYPSDIKKLISWYNILVEAGKDDFESDIPQEEEK